MKAVKEVVRNYYKEIITPWTQPTLTEDGTMGGSTMATTWYWDSATSTSGSAYAAFSPNTEYMGYYCDEYLSRMYVKFYIPIPDFVLSSLSFYNIYYNSSSGPALDIYLYGGKTESTITNQLGYIASVDTNSTGTFTLSSNAKTYQYYILTMTNGGSAHNDQIHIGQVQAIGQGYSVIPGTSSDYDFYVDVDIYKIPKISETYYGVN